MSSTSTQSRPPEAVWRDYWDKYYEQTGNARQVRRVAQEYPVRRGVEVSYTELRDMGMDHELFRSNPDRVIAAGVETFTEFVEDHDEIEKRWDRGFDAMIPHIGDLPDGFGVRDYSNLFEYLNQLVQLDVTVTGEPENKADLMEAAFVCPDDHLTRVHQANLRQQFIDRCPEDGCNKSVYLDPKQSIFARIQRPRVSGEGFEDTLLIIGGEQSRQDDMEVGDEYRVSAIPRADIGDVSTHGDMYIDALYVEPIETEGLV